MTDFVFVRLHVAPCVNRCWHCFCEGSPQGGYMKKEDCYSVIDQLAELKSELETIVFVKGHPDSRSWGTSTFPHVTKSPLDFETCDILSTLPLEFSLLFA